jgi:hypothetical protein
MPGTWRLASALRAWFTTPLWLTLPRRGFLQSGASLTTLLRMLGLALAMGLPACGYYSFSGASLPDDLQTVAILPAENAAAAPIPTLADDLTRLLTDRFVRQTRLRLTDEGRADALLEARLDGYRNDPTAVTGNDQAARNRVTLTARVVLRRTAAGASDDPPLLDRTFQSFADYDPALGADGEAEAARVALRAIADDAFTAATSNW